MHLHNLDFIEIYQNNQPLFDAPHGGLSSFYITAEDSYKAVIELLNFQFDENQNEISEFVNNLCMLVENVVPQKKLHGSGVSSECWQKLFL